MRHAGQDQKQAQLSHPGVAQCRTDPEGLGDAFQNKEQAEDGAQGGFRGRGMIEIAVQSAAESLDASMVPMGKIGESPIFHFAVFTEGLAEEEGGGRSAVGDGGDVHTYYLSHKSVMSRVKLTIT